RHRRGGGAKTGVPGARAPAGAARYRRRDRCQEQPMSNELCAEVTEHMADVLDGSADRRLLDHIAECDSCRDARHDAERARALVERAGADFVAPADLEARLAAALERRKPAP